jgi:hypothetical protein
MNEKAADQIGGIDHSQLRTAKVDNKERRIDEQMRRLVFRLGELIGSTIVGEEGHKPRNK